MWTRLEELFDTHKVVRIVAVGLEQTGKTNNGLFMANLFFNIAYERGSIPVLGYIAWRSPMDTWKRILLLDRLKGIWCREYGCSEYCPDSVFIMIDDMSFTGGVLNHEMRIFLNKMSKIAHKLKWARRIVIYMVTHYSRGILPFLRIGHVRLVTSLTSPAEVEGLKAFFRESSLWRFYEYKTASIRHYKYYTLYNIYGVEFISKPPRSSPPEFTINLSAIRLSEPEKQKRKNIYVVQFSDKRPDVPIIVQKQDGHIYIYYKQRQNGKLRKIRIMRLTPVR